MKCANKTSVNRDPRLCLLTGEGIVEHYSFRWRRGQGEWLATPAFGGRQGFEERDFCSAARWLHSIRVSKQEDNYSASKQVKSRIRAFEVARVFEVELLQGKKLRWFFLSFALELSWTLRKHSELNCPRFKDFLRKQKKERKYWNETMNIL